MPTLDEAKRRYTQYMIKSAAVQAQIAPLINEVTFALAEMGVTPSLTGYPAGTAVSTAQTGNGNSTVYDFGFDGRDNSREMVLVRITASGGTTPTCTYAIQGSTDGTTYNNLPIADISAPTTFSSSTFTIAAVGPTTVVKIVPAGLEYRYLRIAYSANTAMTNTADVYPL